MPKAKSNNIPEMTSDLGTEESVSMAQVRVLLDQQKEIYKALLEQQERSFKTCVEIVFESTNKRVAVLQNEVHELKASLDFTQKEFDELKLSKTVMETVNKSLISLSEKSDYNESQSRRNNLIFDGIQESESETWSDSEAKVKKLLSEKLGIDHQKIELERAHRTGKTSSEATRPRPIVAKFLRFKDKQEVLSNAKKLAGTNIYINEDYPEAVRQKRKDLLPAMKEARKRGDIAYLRYDKLIVHPPSKKPDEKPKSASTKPGSSGR